MRDEQPSATARLIARRLVTLAADPLAGQLVPLRAAQLSEWLAPSNSLFDWLCDTAANSRLSRLLISAVERLTIPGINLHYALRKRYLEETARAALDQGFRQVVVFGAGFDTLALRLHESHPAAQFIEIDHPATQHSKAREIARRNLRKENLHFIALDLAGQNLEEQLRRANYYRAGERTLFIAEGLLMYLAPGEVDEWFGLVRRLGSGAARNRLAFTFMEPRADGRIAFHRSTRAVDLWLRWRGEPFKWGISRERLDSYLATRGFHLREIATAETLRQRYLTEPRFSQLTLADGEYICIADSV
ncbi:MAG: SAM-dependent methyltransferase [Acidobacteriota bacterium]|nr:SAM-dependent methyltransferase [Acidobacteriota bacterium]